MLLFVFLCFFFSFFSFFFFNDTATTEIYTLSLHDALPIFVSVSTFFGTLFDNFDVVELTYDGTNLHQRTMITGVNDFKLKGAFLFAAKSRVSYYTSCCKPSCKLKTCFALIVLF